MSVLLAACAVEPTHDIERIPLQPGDSLIAVDQLDSKLTAEVRVEASLEDDGPDVCALAAQLPSEDLCSQICDPEMLKQSMLDAGVTTGRCYLLLCQLPEDVHVSVGVCLV